jgi:hypothetical protein
MAKKKKAGTTAARRTAKAARKTAKKGRPAAKATKKPAKKQPSRAGKKAAKRPAKKAAGKAGARKAPSRKATAPKGAARKAAPARKAAAKAPARKGLPKAPAAKAATPKRAAKPAPIRGAIPSSLGLEGGASAARSGRDELLQNIKQRTETSPAITAGDVDADWQLAYSSGDEAPGGDNPTPDQDVVDEIGEALGVEYDDEEELKGAAKIEDRDKHRWELDPASKDDFEEEE